MLDSDGDDASVSERNQFTPPSQGLVIEVARQAKVQLGPPATDSSLAVADLLSVESPAEH